MSRINSRSIPKRHEKRLEMISRMFRELRFSEGLCQDEYADHGISRRQIQRAEHCNNLTLLKLFTLIDIYGYSLHEFFEDIE